MLSRALAMYAAGAATAAIAGALLFVDNSLLFGDPLEPRVHLAGAIALYGAFVLYYGSLLFFLASWATLLRTRATAVASDRRAIDSFTMGLSAGVGLALSALPVFAVWMMGGGCLDCTRPFVPVEVGFAGITLLGSGAVLLILSVLSLPMRLRRQQPDALAVHGATLGVVAVLGDIVSMSLFVTGAWVPLGWAAFVGVPFLNLNPLWGGFAAVGSGMLALSYRRFAMGGDRVSDSAILAPPTTSR